MRLGAIPCGKQKWLSFGLTYFNAQKFKLFVFKISSANEIYRFSQIYCHSTPLPISVLANNGVAWYVYFVISYQFIQASFVYRRTSRGSLSMVMRSSSMWAIRLVILKDAMEKPLRCGKMSDVLAFRSLK